MICQKCGKTLSGGAAFCTGCGNKINVQPNTSGFNPAVGNFLGGEMKTKIVMLLMVLSVGFNFIGCMIEFITNIVYGLFSFWYFVSTFLSFVPIAFLAGLFIFKGGKHKDKIIIGNAAYMAFMTLFNMIGMGYSSIQSVFAVFYGLLCILLLVAGSVLVFMKKNPLLLIASILIMLVFNEFGALTSWILRVSFFDAISWIPGETSVIHILRNVFAWLSQPNIWSVMNIIFVLSLLLYRVAFLLFMLDKSIKSSMEDMKPLMSKLGDVKDNIVTGVQSAAQGSTAAQPTASPNMSQSDIDKLKELKDLFELGIISAEEYERKRQEILGRI